MWIRAGKGPRKKSVSGPMAAVRRTLATIVLAASAALVIAPGAKAAVEVDLGNYGVGSSETVIPPSEMNATYLQDTVSFYNTGSPTSITLGSGKNQATYHFTKHEGSLTPATLTAPTKLNSEITSFTGQGSASATLNLASGGFEYLIAQWDGPNGANAVYYVGNLSGTITLNNLNPQFGPGGGYGLSGFWLGGGNNLPPNPNENIVPVPELRSGLAAALMLLPISVWTLLRRR
jgi:hypothetical protein